MNQLKYLALALRFFIEVFALISIGSSIWNYHKLGNLKYVLSLFSVVAVATIWGLFVSPKAAIQLSASAKLLVELVVILLAGTVLYKTGNVRISLIFGIVYSVDKVILVLMNRFGY